MNENDNSVGRDVRNTERMLNNFEELNATFETLDKNLQELLSEDLNLEETGITVLNDRLERLEDLFVQATEFVNNVNNAYNHSSQGGNSNKVKYLSQDEFIDLIEKY